MNRYTYRAITTYKPHYIYGNLIIDTNGNKYIVPERFFSPDGHHLMYYDDTDLPVFIQEDTVSQCTGLKDKHGQYIFENDEVRSPLLGLFVGTVIYDDGCFQMVLYDDDDSITHQYPINSHNCKDIEVIDPSSYSSV